jgi:hypothetical protein
MKRGSDCAHVVEIQVAVGLPVVVEVDPALHGGSATQNPGPFNDL